MKRRDFKLSFILSVLFFLAPFSMSQAEEAEFYQGKTVQVLIGYSAGGGYDSYGRTLARHLSKHIPGNPDVVVKNVPGAGSLVLMNQLSKVLPNDGTVIGFVNSGMPYEPLFGNDQAQFSVSNMSWIGNLNEVTTMGVTRRDTNIKSLSDLGDGNLVVGATGAGSNTNVIPRVIASVLGVDIKVVTGYPGSNEIVLAMERGEVEGMGSRFVSSAKASNPHWFGSESDVNIIYQVGLKRHPDLPDTPLITEFAKDEKQRQILQLLTARLAMGRPIVAPPGIDHERLATLRKAVSDTAVDPEFLADAEQQGLAISYTNPTDMVAFFEEVYSFPEDVVQGLVDAIQ